VEGFYIYYRRFFDSLTSKQQKDSSSTGSYQMLTVLNAGASTFQIVGLDKFATYQVFLVPFYKNVEG
jgi:roundabout axon guidance receptor 2